LYNIINISKRSALTFVPEVDSGRLRNIMEKYFSEKQIGETLFTAKAMGLENNKLTLNP
jgi:hypothetical protein